MTSYGPPPPGGSYGPPPPGGYYGQPQPRKRRAGKAFLLGCGGLIAIVIIVVIIVVVAASGGNSGSGSNAGPGKPAGTIGSKVRDGKFQFVVTGVSHAKKVGDTAAGLGAKAQGEYTILHITVTNVGNQAQTLDDSSQYVYANGRKYDASSDADMVGNGGNGGGVFLNQINPGNTVRGKIYFDLPHGVRAVKAVLHDSAFSDGVVVSLKAP